MKKIFKIGPIRPPSEAYSLLLRVTENCPWNKCKFCTLYKTEQFHTRKVEEVKKDINAMAMWRDCVLSYKGTEKFDMEGLQKRYARLKNIEEKECFLMVFRWLTEDKTKGIFLQDANTMVLKSEWLGEIIRYIREKLPEVQRVTSYGRADTLSKITPREYTILKNSGLDRIHSGYESGSNEVLSLLGKGTTQQQEIEGGKKVKDAGIELSIYFMPGAGGKKLSSENAIETAKVINEINPDFVRLRTFVVKRASEMGAMRKEGTFQECSDIEKVEEIKLLLENIKGCTGYLASDQIINLLEKVEGKMDEDLPKLIDYIDEFLNLPKNRQREFQLIRRMGFNGDWNDMALLSQEDKQMLKEMCSTIVNEVEWENLLHRYLEQYI